MNLLEVRHVSFGYRKNTAVLRDVSFSVEPGITGLVGPNGAGKSTLLRLIAGLEIPESGDILVNGQKPGARLHSETVGLIPETPVFDGYLRVGDFLSGIAAIAQKASDSALAAAYGLLDLRLATLSLGQKRRVELAAAMIGEPRLLLLDEPTNGLDPFAISELRNTLIALKSPSMHIVFSSHHLDELQRIADTIVLIRAGSCPGCWSREAVIRDHGSVENLFHEALGNSLITEPLC